MTKTLTLASKTTATDLPDTWFDGTPRKIETLDECFRRLYNDLNGKRGGLMPHAAERHNTHLWAFLRATAEGTQRPHEALKVVEICAAWVAASLDEIEAHWSSEADRLLAAFNPKDPEASSITYEEFMSGWNSMEISCGLRRTNVTKKAYGITYAEFVAD